MGRIGDHYLDTSGDLPQLYGPKPTIDDWGDPVELGTLGTTLYSGTGAPDSELGADGDHYIDTAATALYGPKNEGWGSAHPFVIVPGDDKELLFNSGGVSGVGGVLAASSAARYTGGKIQLDGNLQFRNTGDSNRTLDLVGTATSSNKTLTLPNATDTLVGKATTDVLSNKTVASPVVTGTTVYQGTRFRIVSVPGEVQTSSTSQTTLASFTMADESHCSFDIIVTYARRTNVTKRATFRRAVSYYRTSAGGATISGSLESGVDQGLTSGDAVTVDASGNDVRVRVTAADTDPRNWSCEIRAQETLAT